MTGPAQINIGFITDAHIAADGAPIWQGIDSVANLQKSVDWLNEQPLDAVVLGGDLADAADMEDDAVAQAMYHAAMPVLEQVKAPLLAIPGNHDRHDLFADFLDKFREDQSAPDMSHQVLIGDWRLLLLDTVEPAQIEGSISDLTIDWLEEIFDADPDKPTLVFTHHPPFGCHEDPEMDMPFGNDDLLTNVLAKCTGLKGLFAGHYHREIAWQWNGAQYHVAPATAGQFQHPKLGGDIKGQDKWPTPGLQHLKLTGAGGDAALAVETIWLGPKPEAA